MTPSKTELKYEFGARMSEFADIEAEGARAIAIYDGLGIMDNLNRAGKLEPSIRAGEISSVAAMQLNALGELAGIGSLVSPVETGQVALLYKSGQGISPEMIDLFRLGEKDPSDFGLYRYPFYAPERTVYDSSVLRTAMLLQESGCPRYARKVLHGPYPDFIETADLSSALVALTNANMTLAPDGKWHSYLYPAVNLLALEPYAVRSDELPPSQAKEDVHRARMVAINTTLQHALRMYAGIELTDEAYDFDFEERKLRWGVVRSTFEQLGMRLPPKGDIQRQKIKNKLLENWISKNNIVGRLKNTQETTPYLLYDHSRMVAELMQHLAQEINLLSNSFDGEAVLDPQYLYNLGLVHDSTKAFTEDELEPYKGLDGYGEEMLRTYPPEVVAVGRVRLDKSHDTVLYAMLRQHEYDNVSRDEYGSEVSVAQDLFSGPYHLQSFIAALLSYADLAVQTDDVRQCSVYMPDITARYLDTTYRYLSDTHIAAIGYAKLMTVAASLSWYLGIKLPKEGSTSCTSDTITRLVPFSPKSRSEAQHCLYQINRVMRIFGVDTPRKMQKLEGNN